MCRRRYRSSQQLLVPAEALEGTRYKRPHARLANPQDHRDVCIREVALIPQKERFSLAPTEDARDFVKPEPKLDSRKRRVGDGLPTKAELDARPPLRPTPAVCSNPSRR